MTRAAIQDERGSETEEADTATSDEQEDGNRRSETIPNLGNCSLAEADRGDGSTGTVPFHRSSLKKRQTLGPGRRQQWWRRGRPAYLAATRDSASREAAYDPGSFCQKTGRRNGGVRATIRNCPNPFRGRSSRTPSRETPKRSRDSLEE